MNFSTPLLVSVFLMGFAQASTAASVLFYYTVEVDEAHGFEPGSLQVGDIVGGSFSYDLNQVDVAPVSDTGEYIISNAEAQMDLYAGGGVIFRMIQVSGHLSVRTTAPVLMCFR